MAIKIPKNAVNFRVVYESSDDTIATYRLPPYRYIDHLECGNGVGYYMTKTGNQVLFCRCGLRIMFEGRAASSLRALIKGEASEAPESEPEPDSDPWPEDLPKRKLDVEPVG